MSDKVGNVSFDMPSAGEYAMDKPYSEQTSQMIDEEVRAIIKAAHIRTGELMKEKKADVEKVIPHFFSSFFSTGKIPAS